MDKTPEEKLNTQLAIEWMQQHGQPLPKTRDFEMESLNSFLNKKMGETGLSTQQLFEQARLERSTGFKIMSGQRRPSREVLLRLAFVLKLSVEEAQWLLKIGRHATLTPRDARDSIVLFGMINRKSLYDVNALLEDAGEELL